MPLKSFIALYRVMPIVFPFRADRHRPSMKASTTAERVSSTGGMSMLKKPGTLFSAVAAIFSSASAFMKLGKRFLETRKETEPPSRVEA
jgi:hypothetical protein